MPPCTLRVWHSHTLITNPLLQQPAASFLSSTDSCVKQHILTLFHSISEITARSLFGGHHMDCMFSAYSKYHWKFQNHSKLLCLGTAGFYAIVLMVQQETEFLQDPVKDVAVALTGIRVCEKPQHFPLHLIDELLLAFPNASHHNLYI